MEKSNASRNGIGHSFRVLRPLVWWLILVLVLYGIRVHERLVAETRLYFSVSLHGQTPSYPVSVTLDGKPFSSGDNVSLGNHRLEITSTKTDPFATNFFAWYGPYEFGNIKLKRSTGTLDVKAVPSAPTITISGPEFSTNLYDSGGITLRVPTDQYTVRVKYAHWSQSQNVTVFANLAASCVFSPDLGALRLSSNKQGVAYRLKSAGGQLVESGSLPAMVASLPIGEYELTALYHHRQIRESETVKTGMTNDVAVKFVLGAVDLETTPSGASVYALNGSYLGQTPLLLADMTPQRAQFNLALSGYEPVAVSLNIAANQTNIWSTNLVSVNYVSAMRDARAYLAASNYTAALQATDWALKAKPGDANALALKNEANKHISGERKLLDRLRRPKQVFDGLCSDYQDANLFKEYELKTGKSAQSVAANIVGALTNAPGAFEIVQNYSPETDIYEVVARQTFSLGILGGTERDALVIIGQAKKDQSQIWFKVLEYAVQNTVVADGLLKFHDDKRLVAVNPSRMRMNSGYRAQLREGVQIVTRKIEQAISY